MRFLIIIVQICKGIYRGVHHEVKRLAKQTKLNELKKQTNEELLIEYQRLGEYIYYLKEEIDDERIQLLYSGIAQLLEQIEQFEQELAQTKDG